MNTVCKAWLTLFSSLMAVFLVYGLNSPLEALAANISQYSDTISNSAPGEASNHRLSFVLKKTIAPGSYIDITPPAGFEIIGTSTFAAARNVEMLVNSVPRSSASILSAANDKVEVTPGIPGMIRYTLNTTSGIAADSQITILIGNKTSKSLETSESYSTTTGTTTNPADIKPIKNSASLGTHKVDMKIYDGGVVANTDFSIVVINRVGAGPADTTETIPPERFNGAPTSTVTGVSLNVEIFLETNEFAICKYSRTPGVSYAAMTNTFGNTGLIYHTSVVAVTPNTTQIFYIRCMDDEGNYNIDDYIIQFDVTDKPTGTANEEGEESGDGSGTGNNGTGSGSGGGGQTGGSNGGSPSSGGSSGGGGSGGGNGGSSGNVDGSTAGGGFEGTDAPYRSGDGRVTITGFASPQANIVVLVDGKEATRSRADSTGAYEVVLDEIARGAYTFGIYALDPAAVRSSTFSTSFTVSGARTSALSNINLAPTIKVTPDPAIPGTPVIFSGYTLANAVVAIEIDRDGPGSNRKTYSATANSVGLWSLSVETTGMSVGTYKVRAKATYPDGTATNFSAYTLFGVGQNAVRPINADLNRDGKVNLVDFSILLFWWGTNGGTSDPSADINGDSKVNLVDFSILLFNWTG